MTGPKVSVRRYTLVFGVLLLLALSTTLIGMLNLGPFNMVVAITIAAAKAALIAAFFMQALYESKIVRIVITGGIVWFLIMETLTLGDYMSRGWLAFPGK
ncbi:MAG: oxidase [Acidobacteriaceae bacterium]|nr:oxidase [Acidobacteriaceae bacterium]